MVLEHLRWVGRNAPKALGRKPVRTGPLPLTSFQRGPGLDRLIVRAIRLVYGRG
ncbi:hypothetical protein [Nocardia huaxiensis]|uniref:Uncharacterized protein n=1 Tax=Nocardia huaxiensis TaxID=2755382 RepID=A0A7D6VDS7_9NOCA|nr:hypothetical protein [Nocardia huaxiensis]QLY30477.1 hypothetical protein H0264_36085 [Nocardia huaxiensis]UFS95924.1 hypothetical protein LPY97_35595 [Nocardia huaxiensis]